ncbi:MAG: caspase family protein [Acidobacteriota bacterium]
MQTKNPLLLLAVAVPLLVADMAVADEAPRTPEDLLVVDCLLPQKVRRLGRRSTFLAPRQPIRTTAVDCRIRGGEYTEPDQANYATALKVWQPRATDGDAEAQFFVGQIHERGLGTAPDVTQAAEWYRRAADQGHTPSMVALGHLLETGQGVERDEVAALDWYRKAAGLSDDLVVLQAAEAEALREARDALGAREAEAEQLRREVDELKQQLDDMASEGEASERRQATLRSVLERLETDLAQARGALETSRERVATLEASTTATAEPVGVAPALASLGDVPFGDYHALVIGNGGYRDLPALPGARAQAEAVAEVLEGRYGFEVRRLLDADRFSILKALNTLREELTSDDNLLVYYAGHGERDAAGQTAYWQPIDARASSPANWIASAVVTELLDLVPANHVFVVADAVYGGLRTRSSVAQLPTGMTDDERSNAVRDLVEKRARLVLTSGGPGPLGPDPDGSTFASAFADVLRDNEGVLEASSLYRQVNDRVAEADGRSSVALAGMRWARHDVSDFFFVPRPGR